MKNSQTSRCAGSAKSWHLLNHKGLTYADKRPLVLMLQEAIANAKTLEEVNRLEAKLKQGEGLGDEDNMAE